MVRTDSGASCLVPLRADAEGGSCRFSGPWSSKVHGGEGLLWERLKVHLLHTSGQGRSPSLLALLDGTGLQSMGVLYPVKA
jgi:hypothetical protein